MTSTPDQANATDPAHPPADELPVFPAAAPAIISDRAATSELFAEVLTRLGSVVDAPADRLDGPTPCAGFTVGELQQHVLAWLQFFAAALTDPSGTAERLDPDTWSRPDGTAGSSIVATAAADIARAIAELPDGELVVMNEARMSKEAVLAMALGEYLTHGWDLSVSTGADWTPVDEAVAPAHEFLQGTIVPEYRGPDSGFFGHEVPAPDGASAFERYLCFCGRDPQWSAAG